MLLDGRCAYDLRDREGNSSIGKFLRVLFRDVDHRVDMGKPRTCEVGPPELLLNSVDDDIWTEFINFRVEKQAYRYRVLAGVAPAIVLELVIRLAEMGFKGSRKLAKNGRRDFSAVSELVEVDRPLPVVEGHLIRGHSALVGFGDSFILLSLEMLHLDEHEITIAGKVREFPELGLVVLFIIQRPAAKVMDDKMRESGGQIRWAAGSFDVNGHVTTLWELP